MFPVKYFPKGQFAPRYFPPGLEITGTVTIVANRTNILTNVPNPSFIEGAGILSSPLVSDISFGSSIPQIIYTTVVSADIGRIDLQSFDASILFGTTFSADISNISFNAVDSSVSILQRIEIDSSAIYFQGLGPEFVLGATANPIITEIVVGLNPTSISAGLTTSPTLLDLSFGILPSEIVIPKVVIPDSSSITFDVLNPELSASIRFITDAVVASFSSLDADVFTGVLYNADIIDIVFNALQTLSGEAQYEFVDYLIKQEINKYYTSSLESDHYLMSRLVNEISKTINLDSQIDFSSRLSDIRNNK